MLESRAKLPTAELKDDILRLLKENNVLVVCGETGCGKTTQVETIVYILCLYFIPKCSNASISSMKHPFLFLILIVKIC